MSLASYVKKKIGFNLTNQAVFLFHDVVFVIPQKPYQGTLDGD